MNDIQCLIDRQLGIYCRLNYDNVLKRLVVENEESFYGLQNSSVLPSFDQDPPIFACRFSEAPGCEHILALANEDGRVAIQDTSTAKTASALESFQCHNNAVFDLAWVPGQMSFVTVSGDHTACLWDAGQGAPRRVHVFAGHTRSVKCAAFPCGAPALLATGARDGAVLVWDARAGAARPDVRLAACHAPAPPPGRRRAEPRAASVTGLAFQHERALLSAGECDGNVKLWDLRRTYSAHSRDPLPRHAIPYCGSSARNGYSNLLVDAARARLYASCMDDVIYCFDIGTYASLPERRYVGHENSTFYIKTALSPDGEYLVSGSSDKRAHVWSVRGGAALARLAGHRAEVTCAAWCQRGDPKLVTCGDDARHMLWRVGPEWPPPGAAPPGRAEPPPPRAPARTWRPPPAAPRPVRPARRCLGAPGAKRPRDPSPTAPGAKRPRDPSPPAPGAKRAREATPPAREATPPAREATPPAPRSPPAAPRSPPTRDLPDYVRSGEAPHLRLMSPAKKRDTTDWLTRLARARRARGEAPPAPPPAPRTPPPPARRPSAAERTPRSAKRSRTLLKYFTVTGGPK